MEREAQRTHDNTDTSAQLTQTQSIEARGRGRDMGTEGEAKRESDYCSQGETKRQNERHLAQRCPELCSLDPARGRSSAVKSA